MRERVLRLEVLDALADGHFLGLLLAHRVRQGTQRLVLRMRLPNLALYQISADYPGITLYLSGYKLIRQTRIPIRPYPGYAPDSPGYAPDIRDKCADRAHIMCG